MNLNEQYLIIAEQLDVSSNCANCKSSGLIFDTEETLERAFFKKQELLDTTNIMSARIFKQVVVEVVEKEVEPISYPIEEGS